MDSEWGRWRIEEKRKKIVENTGKGSICREHSDFRGELLRGKFRNCDRNKGNLGPSKAKKTLKKMN